MYSSVAIVAPPASEPVTLAQVRRHARIDTEDEDDLLQIYLMSARQMVETFLGRALITQTLRWTMARVAPQSQFPMYPFTAFIFPMWMPYSMLFSRPVELPRSTVQSILSVQMGQWGQQDIVLSPQQYNADLATDPARIQINAGAGDYPSDHTIIDFVAGYGSDQASVPVPIQHAILMLAAFMNEHRGDDGGEIPPFIQHLLWPYRLVTFGGGDG